MFNKRIQPNETLWSKRQYKLQKKSIRRKRKDAYEIPWQGKPVTGLHSNPGRFFTPPSLLFDLRALRSRGTPCPSDWSRWGPGIRSFPLAYIPEYRLERPPVDSHQLGSPRLTSVDETCSTIVDGWEPSLDSGRHGWSPEAAPWRNEQIRRRHFWRWNPTRWGPDVPRVRRHSRALPALLFDEYAYPCFALHVPLWTPSFGPDSPDRFAKHQAWSLSLTFRRLIDIGGIDIGNF